MPQISKVRIVNFQYNDGKRLIADELYDFESENKGPSDILINLANGGGKSVLVQLMMQPIIPRAKVAGRRIESFFTKASDHCFVVIEWVLDQSKMRLMTGIAMAASDSSRDVDQDRGFQIKYYTFISSYQVRDSYDIVSLPLSRKENGRFIPAAFDDIRNLAKRSGGKLDRYASDDSMKWAERLAQYGIVQSEWRMIEELNSNEDGLSKYFSNLKTSDAVIDKLIIPRIEDKENRSTLRDDSSLETMLISYAKQFSKQQDIIKEREICAGFYNMLEKTKVNAENLWKSNDSLEECIGNLFAYVDAMDAEIAKQSKKTEMLSEEKSKLNETIRHIRWERASSDYYTCKEVFESETASLREAEENKSSAREALEEAKKKLLLIECAHYYGLLKEIESKIAAINIEITNRENNSESAERLASLKYSAYLKIMEELQKLISETDLLSSQQGDLETSIRSFEADLAEIEREINNVKEKKDKAEAIYEKQIQDDDEIAQEIGLAALRKLDGKYQESDLEDFRWALRNNEETLTADISDIKEKLQKLEDRREEIPQKFADIDNQLLGITNEIEKLDHELSEFEEAKDKVLAAFDKYSLSKEMLYSEHAASFLKEKISEVQAEVSSVARKIEATEEALSAVKRGTLHIPKIITAFLDNAGIPYTSVEKYLLAQQTNGLLSTEDCQRLLENYPFAAYGIIVETKDIETLYQEADDKWLPAILPVFTASDIERFMQGESADFQALSAYSKEYFYDRDVYETKLTVSLEDQRQRKTVLEGRIDGLQNDVETIKTLDQYDAGWEQTTLEKKAELETQRAEKSGRKAELKQEQSELKAEIIKDREELQNLTDSLKEIRSKKSSFEKLIIKLEEESQLYHAYEISARKLRELADVQKDKNTKKTSLDKQLISVTSHLKELKATGQSLREGLASVDNAHEAAIISGEWATLLAQYKTLLDSQSADLKRLNDDKDKLQNDREEKLKEITKRNCAQDEYEDLTYSEELESDASNSASASESVYQAVSEAYNNVSRSQAKAEALFENAVKDLSSFGGAALPASEIGKAFDSRIAETENKIGLIDSDIKEVNSVLSKLHTAQAKAENAIEQYSRPAKLVSIVLDKDYSAQLNGLTKQIREWNQSVSSSRHDVEENLKSMASDYGAKSTDVSLAIHSMQELLSSDVIRGDKYYTLCEHIDANMHTANLRISQIDTDLKEFNKTKGDLIHQCVIQGRQMYEGLQKLSSNSKIKVQDKRRQMIRFDIPEAIDENIANNSILEEVEKGAAEIAAKLLEDSYAESEIRKIAGRIVGSKRLLRKYINQENIVLRAYKIDRNPDNSGYRTWEQTQVNNSGAEKFVVYFAVILALMTFARDTQDDFGGKSNRSVLILDNPFGPISSKHVLEPMFEISRNYKVQMICLSDISKSDIVSCFDLVIRAIVKQFKFSNKEQLTHDGNELIEHGFYRAEQLTLR